MGAVIGNEWVEARIDFTHLTCQKMSVLGQDRLTLKIAKQ